uniref:Uncharacterized protein n=1 Tax=Oryza glumipatula TaxID=40148 RepID=A0A0D9YPJ0_9ORYZ
MPLVEVVQRLMGGDDQSDQTHTTGVDVMRCVTPCKRRSGSGGRKVTGDSAAPAAADPFLHPCLAPSRLSIS